MSPYTNSQIKHTIPLTRIPLSLRHYARHYKGKKGQNEYNEPKRGNKITCKLSTEILKHPSNLFECFALPSEIF